MSQRLSPDAARQKFYTGKLSMGCAFVAFYNHSSRDFTAEEVSQLTGEAVRRYSDLPWQTFMGSPIKYFVWVDISEKEVAVGVALLASQTACGHFDRLRKDETIEDIVIQLAVYAEGWRTKPGVVYSLESAGMVRSLTDVVGKFESPD